MPGIQPTSVKRRLIKNSVPSPCFKNTANGGKRKLNSMVNIDIIYVLLVRYKIITLLGFNLT